MFVSDRRIRRLKPDWMRGSSIPEELPPIDAITVDTDIRAFLKSRVPAELTRAALRRAWTSDPAIRDFIGIAENQWDFNDPTAIPGFGPLLETDDISALLRQAFGQPAELVSAIAELPMAVEPPAPAEIVREIGTPDPAGYSGRIEGTAVERAEIEHPLRNRKVVLRQNAAHMAAHCRDREFQIGCSTGSRRGQNDAGACLPQFSRA